MYQGIVLLFTMVIYNMFMIKNISYNSFSFMVIFFLYKIRNKYDNTLFSDNMNGCHICDI
jgi:hypothetical protein